MGKLLSIQPEDSEAALYRNHALEMRRQAHFAYLEAEAAIEEWSAPSIDPNNVALVGERENFLAANRQRAANLEARYHYWDERVKQYGPPKEAKPSKP